MVSLNKIGLVRRFDVTLRLSQVGSTGTVNITVDGADFTNLNYALVTAKNTCSDACPLVVNYHAGSASVGIVPQLVNQIVAVVFISKPPVTSGLNLSCYNASHPLGNVVYIIFQFR